MDDLDGKVAVITGGASGIGFAMARRFGAAGMKVVLADVERPVLERAGTQLAEAGVDVLTVPTDVSLNDEVQALAAITLEHFGDVHLVCNNAGVGSRGLLVAELPLADFQWVVAVNLFGVIHGLQAFLPHLRANDVGHIVNTASISGLYHLPRMGPYNASKAAVIALSETLRFELAAEGSRVGVSVLCPSWVRTNISTSDRNRPERFAYTVGTDQSPRPPSTRPGGANSWRPSPSTRQTSPSRCTTPCAPTASTSSPTPRASRLSRTGCDGSSSARTRRNPRMKERTR